MHVIFFRSDGWESWDVEFEPLVRAGMPVLVDDDLLFEDAPGRPRPAVVANQWLRELPTSGALSPNTWEAYARALRDWLMFLAERGVGVFEERDRLRSGLSLYAEYRLSGPLDVRLAEKSWDLHTTVLACFYDWAVAEGARSGDAVHLRVGEAAGARASGRRAAQPREAPVAAQPHGDQVPGALAFVLFGNGGVPVHIGQTGQFRLRLNALHQAGLVWESWLAQLCDGCHDADEVKRALIKKYGEPNVAALPPHATLPV